jgi:hypothetical protein
LTVKRLVGTAIYWICYIVAVPHVAFAAYIMTVSDPERPMETEDRLIISGIFLTLALLVWLIGFAIYRMTRAPGSSSNPRFRVSSPVPTVSGRDQEPSHNPPPPSPVIETAPLVAPQS